MIPIVKWTLWQRRWSVAWWSIGLFSFIFINLVFYPTIRDQAAELQKTFANLPQSAVRFFGGSTDFFSSVGYLNSKIFFLTMPLLLGILAIGLGSSLLAREEQDRTIEALLSRPISRTKLLIAKAIAGVIILSTVSLVSLATIVGLGWIIDLDVPAMNIVSTTFVCWLLALCLGSIAWALTAIGRTRSASLGIATTIALGGYIISSLASDVDWLKPISYIFPFHYYQPEAILRGTQNWSYLIFFLALIFACSLLSWLSFRRRDIV